VGLIKGYLSRNHIEFCENETVNVSDVPFVFQGVPIALITAGLMSMAFMGFIGLA
jgi:Na+-translocating ferredoxin:NAD+ oxidoreductase RnfA subunit